MEWRIRWTENSNTDCLTFQPLHARTHIFYIFQWLSDFTYSDTENFKYCWAKMKHMVRNRLITSPPYPPPPPPMRCNVLPQVQCVNVGLTATHFAANLQILSPTHLTHFYFVRWLKPSICTWSRAWPVLSSPVSSTNQPIKLHVFLESVLITQLGKKFSIFYGTLSFITLFKRHVIGIHLTPIFRSLLPSLHLYFLRSSYPSILLGSNIDTGSIICFFLMLGSSPPFMEPEGS